MNSSLFSKRVTVAILVVAWIAFALHYVFDPRAMFAPYGDTGGDVFSTGMIAAALTSVRSVFDAFSWQPWADYPAFIYLSMGPFIAAVPLQWILHDPFKAVKLVYVLQLTIAFCATAALYGKLFGPTGWRWFAAATYVAMPLVTLQTRLMGFGWVAALIPAALLVNLWLWRRFGALAAPAIGIVCSIASAVFTVEYAIFVGVPLLALSFAVNRWKGFHSGILAWAAAFAAFVCLPAYTIFPTLLGHHLMDWIATGQATQASLNLYSQTFSDQVAGILREATLSGDPAFNASPSQPYAVFAGSIAWILALVALGVGIKTGNPRRWWPVAAIGTALLVLSFGLAFPVAGPLLWSAIGKLPVLRDVRTPDRFAQINALLVALGAACGASLIASRVRWGMPIAAVLGLVTIGAYAAFNVGAHVLALQAVSDRLPGYEGVTSAVDRIGGRTVVLGFPLHGSQYDWPPYAPDAPRVVFAWDLAGRYGRSDAGVALLRRAAVRTVVTTPNWTRDGEAGLPTDMADLVSRSVFARKAGDYDQGVKVFDVGARPVIASVRKVCAYAGPAAFEWAAGLRRFDNDGFVHGDSTSRCPWTLFADYDPLDEALPKASLAIWSGTAALGDSQPLPLPNAFEIDRFGIAAPWYRNAYKGDSLLSATPFMTYGYSSATLSFTVTRPNRYALYVRASGLAALQTTDALGRQIVGNSKRVEGFAWVKIPLGRFGAGTHRLPLEVTDAPEADMPAVVDTVAIATEADPSIALQPSSIMDTTRVFEPPVAVRSLQYLFPRPNSGVITAEGQNVRLSSGASVGLFGGEARVVAQGVVGRARFHWYGPTGMYVVAASGWFNEHAPTMTLETGGQTLRIRYDPSIGIAQSQGYARMKLAHGAPIDVSLDGRPGGIAALTKIFVMPVQAEETPTSYDQSSEIWEFGKSDPMQFYEAIHSSDVGIASGSIRAYPGVSAQIPFLPVFAGGRVTANVQVSGGRGTALLRCGDRVDSSAIGSGSENPGGAALVVERNQDVPCALTVQWNSETLTLDSVVIHARGSRVANWSATQYFAGAAFVWTSQSPQIDLTVDGRPWPRGERRALRAGWHRLTVRRAPSKMDPLIFTAGDEAAPAPPAASVRERSATSWEVASASATTLEAAQFDDGNWYARGASQIAPGYSCDLVNTCFDVAKGNELVSRRLGSVAAIGLWISILDVAIAVVLLFWPEIVASSRREALRPA